MNRIQISIFPRPTVQKHIEKESFTEKVIILKEHAYFSNGTCMIFFVFALFSTREAPA